MSSEPGPFPTLGHSSYTNQSAPWRECINPKECMSLIVEPGPFPTLGHSSYTNQSAPWRECINPKECLSLIVEPGPFPTLIPPTLIKVHPGENV
jgi:hypothetical protein